MSKLIEVVKANCEDKARRLLDEYDFLKHIQNIRREKITERARRRIEAVTTEEEKEKEKEIEKGEHELEDVKQQEENKTFGWEPNQVDSDGRTALDLACRSGLFDIFYDLWNHPSVDVNKGNSHGATPFFIACQEGHTRIVQHCLMSYEYNRRLAEEKIIQKQGGKKGSCKLSKEESDSNQGVVKTTEEMNEKNKENEVGQLEGSVNGAKKLGDVQQLNKKILISRPAFNNATPLYIACQNGHDEIVRLILESKLININATTVTLASPLFICCQYNQIKVLHLLLRNETVKVNSSTHCGASGLLVAVERKCLETVYTLLMDARCDLNLTRNDGTTPLFIGACHSALNCILLLIASGRWLDTTPTWALSGQTALQYSRDNLLTEIASWLEQYEKDPTATTRAAREKLKYLFGLQTKEKNGRPFDEVSKGQRFLFDCADGRLDDVKLAVREMRKRRMKAV